MKRFGRSSAHCKISYNCFPHRILTVLKISQCCAVGSPSVDFYVTTPDKSPHTSEMKHLDKAVTVQLGSNVTLVCTAKMPLGFPPYLRSYLEPNLIKLFVNYSFIREFNCDKKPRKVKTCSLSLVNVKPGDKGKYFCQAVNELGCTYKQLKVAITGGR